ncbi:hypothetical protein SAMN05421819_1284 [Bryocella elongata]|uniref:TolB amino-terminal domain-containing protein n=1 Tax=Bryocella elongata TaxID=863522 RepID=A0A1H5VSK5_9BACT|nr:hypothetical protein [Bryocella elongata]SEF89958.1 hypothetical protein SAMN05421819_1284 [Bryocella elongata]
MHNQIRAVIRTIASRVRPHQAIPSRVDPRELIGLELDNILASDSFKGSKRCQAFLRYVVEAASTGNADQLKERTLGIDLFGRTPDYDTGDDAIVRVKANEVRKRLAQYSLGADPARRVRIELPAGSYAPQFDWYKDSARIVPSRRGVLVSRWAVVSAVMLCTVAGVSAVMHSRDPLRLFWEPMLGGSSSPIVCLGHPDVYIPTHGEPAMDEARSRPLQSLRPVAYVTSSESRTHPDVELIRDGYVGIGDSNASFLIGRALQSFGRGSQARLGDDVSFSDLKKAPAVLVGGFSNRWTMSMTNGLRFSFAEQDDKRVIVDRDRPSTFWSVPSLSKTGHATEDYAIVSRVLVARTGQSLVSIAGISGYGSQAAGEFVTDPAAIQKLTRSAPKGWERMNLQLVLRTKVVGETPGPAEVVASYYWR